MCKSSGLIPRVDNFGGMERSSMSAIKAIGAGMLFLASSLAFGQDLISIPRANDSRPERFVHEVLELTNKVRTENGLQPLNSNPFLNRAAVWMAQDMSKNGYCKHTDSLGRGVPDRLEAHGYEKWGRVSENLAAGYMTPAEAVEAWLNSPGHRANLLDPKVTEIGVAFLYDPTAKHGYYWVQDFGRPLR